VGCWLLGAERRCGEHVGADVECEDLQDAERQWN
jgi:hypothetical protein